MQALDRRRIFEILDQARTGDPVSRGCDLALVSLIVLNVAAAIAESIPAVGVRYAAAFAGFELLSVMVFSVEYVLRVTTIVDGPDPRFHHPLKGRLRYMATPIAVTDLLAFLPFYLTAIVNIDLRMLRVLRLIRIFKLGHYFSALGIVLDVIRMERRAFGAAYFLVVLGLLAAASGIYVFEHDAQPEAFGSIPAALWWAVATLTTVGYGDVTPVTLGGRAFATAVMMLGIGVVALPTGIFASGFALELRSRRDEYAREVRTAMADGMIDSEERAHLEAVRESLALTEEAIRGLEPPEPIPLATCPHCGELLLGPAKDPTPGAP